MKLFVTGTDTDVGKTIASAWLIHKLNAAYWKPVQSGLDGETDIDTIRRLTSLDERYIFQPSYELPEPLSPHEAARRAGITIEMDRFVLPRSDKPLIIEGAGGVLVPLNDQDMMVDLMTHLDAPVVLICRSELGTINHTLLSLEGLRARGIEIRGVIINGPAAPHNARALKQYGGVDVIAEIPQLEYLTRETISRIPAITDLSGLAI